MRATGAARLPPVGHSRRSSGRPSRPSARRADRRNTSAEASGSPCPVVPGVTATGSQTTLAPASR